MAPQVSASAFVEFLDSVDGVGKRSHGDFLSRVVRAFEQCEVVEETDLIGAQFDCAVSCMMLACMFVASGMNASLIPKDLYKTAEGRPSAAMQSFMERAILKVCRLLRDMLHRRGTPHPSWFVRKANDNMRKALATSDMLPAAISSAGSSAAPAVGDTIADLVKAVRQEDAKVHVNIPARMQKVTLDLPAACHPQCDPTDQLAAAKEKLRKRAPGGML